MKEHTFSIIKPDAMKARQAGEILSRLEKAGFEVVALRLRRLTLSTPGRSHRSLADHVRLVGALEDRDGELASALIKANVLGALKLLEQLLADGPPDAKARSELEFQ